MPTQATRRHRGPAQSNNYIAVHYQIMNKALRTLNTTAASSHGGEVHVVVGWMDGYRSDAKGREGRALLKNAGRIILSHETEKQKVTHPARALSH